jgi:phosphoglycerol transferase
MDNRMLSQNLTSPRARLILASFAVVAVVAAVLQFGFIHPNLDITAPIVYAQDGVLDGVMVQGMLEGDYFPPGVIRSDRLAAPGTFSLGDFPTFDAFHLLWMKAISLFTSNPFLVINLYYLFSFFLSGLCFLWTARAFRIRYPLAITGSVLFAFGAFPQARIQHLFLAAYYIIPPLIWVIAQCWSEKPLVEKNARGRWTIDWKDSRLPWIVAITLIGGWSGIYFTAFFLVLATFSAVHSAFFFRSWTRLVSSLLPVVLLFGSFVVGALPNITHSVVHGKTAIGGRHFSETEVLGLTLPEALLPIVTAPNIAWIREHIGKKYVTPMPRTDATYIGGWASLGFMTAVFFGLFYGVNAGRSLPAQFGLVSVFLLLYALRGGLGLMFSILVSPQIRALSRIVIFMAPLGLFTIGAFLSSWPKRRWFVYVAGALMLATGLVDQVFYRGLDNHPTFGPQYTQDREYFPQIEAKLPPGSAVFQLPVMEFPETGGKHKMIDYDQLRPFLHTKTLRWSAGAASGRETIRQHYQLGAMPMDIEAIRKAGFSAILIDNNGYTDEAKGLREHLAARLRTDPIVSPDGRWVTFILPRS